MLTITDFSCGYGDKFSINNISFTALQGAVTGIIGPNGSGKTTLFRGIAAELPTGSGHIEISGTNLHDMSPKTRAQTLAVVAQETEKLPIAVYDYVMMGRMPYRAPFQFFETAADHRVVEKYLQLTNVAALKDKLLSQLSGGERQLVSIARALAQEPAVLLLDEPTSNLDISHEMDVLNLIHQLDHEMDLTVLIILHDLNLASEFCDKIVMMKDGGVFTVGTPSEVLTYDHIETVYGTVVITKTNPLSGKPAIFPVSQKLLDTQKKGSP